MKTRLAEWLIPAFAALGLGDAAYLSVLHLSGELPPCGGYSGCAEVNLSPFAEIFGVPVAVLGSLLYLMLLGVALFRLHAEGRFYGEMTLALYGLSLSGAVFLSYLTGVELFVLRAVCYWCLALALLTLALLAMVTNEVWAFGRRGTPPTQL